MARSLFNLANYYRRFIQDFSKVAKILCDLLKKWLSQEWDKLCHQALRELNGKLFWPPVLKFTEFVKPFELYTGASDFATGDVLMQDGWPLHMRAQSSIVVKGDNQVMGNNSSP